MNRIWLLRHRSTFLKNDRASTKLSFHRVITFTRMQRLTRNEFFRRCLISSLYFPQLPAVICVLDMLKVKECTSAIFSRLHSSTVKRLDVSPSKSFTECARLVGKYIIICQNNALIVDWLWYLRNMSSHDTSLCLRCVEYRQHCC